MATTDNRDVPKEQIFGPMVMDRGCLRASEAWTREHQSLGLQALVPFPKWPRKPKGCVKWFQKASTAVGSRTFPVYCRLLQSR